MLQFFERIKVFFGTQTGCKFQTHVPAVKIAVEIVEKSLHRCVVAVVQSGACAYVHYRSVFVSVHMGYGGINALSGHMDALSRRRNRITVLTPHEGEFVRAGGDLSPGRERAAADFAREHGVYLVLKGPGTIAAAPDGRCMRNPTGNCGMAKGGSGDVLTGLLTGLLAQGMEPFDACCAAVWIHGRAGDMAAEEKGRRGMTPADMIEKLPYALKEVE